MNPLAVPDPSHFIEIGSQFRVPARPGPRPTTSEAPTGTLIAHQQLTQNAPVHMQQAVYFRTAALPHVSTGHSLISLPGARAFFLEEALVRGRLSYGNEFAHLHPPADGSLHVNLPPLVIAEINAAGWGEPHPRDPWAVMVYGPRDDGELEIVAKLVWLAYLHARGDLGAPA